MVHDELHQLVNLVRWESILSKFRQHPKFSLWLICPICSNHWTARWWRTWKIKFKFCHDFFSLDLLQTMLFRGTILNKIQQATYRPLHQPTNNYERNAPWKIHRSLDASSCFDSPFYQPQQFPLTSDSVTVKTFCAVKRAFINSWDKYLLAFKCLLVKITGLLVVRSILCHNSLFVTVRFELSVCLCFTLCYPFMKSCFVLSVLFMSRMTSDSMPASLMTINFMTVCRFVIRIFQFLMKFTADYTSFHCWTTIFSPMILTFFLPFGLKCAHCVTSVQGPNTWTISFASKQNMFVFSRKTLGYYQIIHDNLVQLKLDKS